MSSSSPSADDLWQKPWASHRIIGDLFIKAEAADRRIPGWNQTFAITF